MAKQQRMLTNENTCAKIKPRMEWGVSMRKCTAFNVAQLLVNLFHVVDIPITHLKLQKLLYFVQGEHYKLTGEPFFEDDFEAWRFGPVVPTVYSAFAKYANLEIPKQENELEQLQPTQAKAIVQTIGKYGKKSARELVDISHQQSPWKIAYELYGSGTIIPKENIRSYFCS